MTEILHIHPRAPEEDLIEQAVDFLRNGHVVAYPTETFYGLGVDFSNERAIKRLYELKRRDQGLPIALLVADMPMLAHCVTAIPDPARLMMRRFWPGPLTICFSAAETISRSLTTNTGKIGIRISSHPIATAMVRQFGRPMTTTSANLSGYPPSLEVRHVRRYFQDRIDCIVDGGECIASRGSTVIDIADETMAIIREGAVPSDDVIKCFQQG
ncbi:MAG: threonylcarbamoyl-AMP synthase [Deltaproteobacteria bacterium]|nr:threonylcarbamoyl-AMP synthase [Deltaproteobacteria bacterium]